ncbi:MAG: hypothetical protein ABID38_00090 [Candidatus Diapherotrites archaeon]
MQKDNATGLIYTLWLIFLGYMAAKTPPKKRKKIKTPESLKTENRRLRDILKRKGLPGLRKELKKWYGEKALKDLTNSIKHISINIIINEISDIIVKRETSKAKNLPAGKKITFTIAIKSRESQRLKKLYRKEGIFALQSEIKKLSNGGFPNALREKIRENTIEIIKNAIMRKKFHKFS